MNLLREPTLSMHAFSFFAALATAAIAVYCYCCCHVSLAAKAGGVHCKGSLEATSAWCSDLLSTHCNVTLCLGVVCALVLDALAAVGATAAGPAVLVSWVWVMFLCQALAFLCRLHAAWLPGTTMQARSVSINMRVELQCILATGWSQQLSVELVQLGCC
jgi:hypothetical protein